MEKGTNQSACSHYTSGRLGEATDGSASLHSTQRGTRYVLEVLPPVFESALPLRQICHAAIAPRPAAEQYGERTPMSTQAPTGPDELRIAKLSIEDLAQDSSNPDISYVTYKGEQDVPTIMSLVDLELSEPYNWYTYRYFLVDWSVYITSSLSFLTSDAAVRRCARPHLCFLVRMLVHSTKSSCAERIAIGLRRRGSGRNCSVQARTTPRQARPRLPRYALGQTVAPRQRHRSVLTLRAGLMKEFNELIDTGCSDASCTACDFAHATRWMPRSGARDRI